MSSLIRVTVTQLHDSPHRLTTDWAALVEHVRENQPDLVLLPEFPFSRWFFQTRRFQQAVWNDSVKEHERWLGRLPELGRAAVLGSRPVNDGASRYNEGFVWDAARGYRSAHRKCYLPDEDGFWEASWYHRGPREFNLIDVGPVKVGFLICTEMWFTEHARAYGRQGAHLIYTPRMNEPATVSRWQTGAQALSMVSGAYVASSARYGTPSSGGVGWMIAPDGDVMATTSEDQRFRTVTIDLAVAGAAKRTYPRYVDDA